MDVGVEKEYVILLQYPEDNTITLDWDNAGWSNLGTFTLRRNDFKENLFNILLVQYCMGWRMWRDQLGSK